MTGICIALDAMGGDLGPSVIVPAALKALATYPNLHIILVGIGPSLSAALKEQGVTSHQRLIVREVSQVVAMDESPALALRGKRDSSMRVALDLVKSGTAQACVSAGNTGALMAMARFVLKMLPGVDRPAIVYSLPTMQGQVHMLDLGANVNCTAQHLFQFAVMGSIAATAINTQLKPRIGLLNIGAEAIKGSEVVKEAAQLLSNAEDLNYIGFVEGDDIYKGTADVVVCDGFVGNIALKTSEGLVKMILKFAKDAFTDSLYARCVAILAFPILKRLKRRLDPTQYNGASFLGIQGIVIKSHGNAGTEAFGTAIRIAMLEVERNVPEKIRVQVAQLLGCA